MEIPPAVRRAKAKDGRFVIMEKNSEAIHTRTDCAHVARRYGEDGHPVWKLSGASHVATFRYY